MNISNDIINNIEHAMRTVGYTTNNSAVALTIIEQNQADWADGFSTMCIDEALQLTGDYSGFCRGDLKRWASAVRRNVREVATYVVGTVCRSLHLAFYADDVSARLADALYIDNYEPLKSVGKFSSQLSTVDVDSLFKPHKSMVDSLPSECQAVVMQAKRELRRLFASLVEKLTKLKQEATRKEARKSVEVSAWVKDLRHRKAEKKSLFGDSLNADLRKVMDNLEYSRREAIDFMIGAQEELIADNPFYKLYEQTGEVELKFAAEVRRMSGSCQAAELDQFVEVMAKLEWLNEAQCASSEERGVRSEELNAPLPANIVSKTSNLKLSPTQEDAFSLAVSRGYMSPNGDGTYTWKLPKVLLAYFLGRLFCDDYISTDNVASRKEWTNGGKDFPEQQLCRLFGMSSISTNRRTRLGKVLPDGYEKIESLIEEIE